MTFLMVALLGLGMVLIASALDNSSLVDTFRKIINNESIDWSGKLGNTQAGLATAKTIQNTPQDVSHNTPLA